MATFKEQLRSCTQLNLSPVGTGGGNAVDAISIVPVANSSAAAKMTISNASLAQATTFTVPDPGAGTTNFMVSVGALTDSYLLMASGSNGGVQSSGLAFTSIPTITVVSLSTSQVTGAYTTPVQLLAAAGANTLILLERAFIYTASTGQTAFASGGVGIIQYGNTAHGAGTNALSGTIAAANITAAANQSIMGVGSVSALSSVSNTGLFFSNQTGSFTNGTGSTVNIVLITRTFGFNV